jgi:hypothetical protein
MTIQADELTYLRLNTKAFIDADYKDIVLNRVTREDNGAGGFTETENPVAAQRLRLIPQQGNMSPLRETLDGEAVQPDYVLLGEWNSDIQRWDTFADGNRRYQVLFVHEKSTYERKGEVKYLGEV